MLGGLCHVPCAMPVRQCRHVAGVLCCLYLYAYPQWLPHAGTRLSQHEGVALHMQTTLNVLLIALLAACAWLQGATRTSSGSSTGTHSSSAATTATGPGLSSSQPPPPLWFGTLNPQSSLNVPTTARLQLPPSMPAKQRAAKLAEAERCLQYMAARRTTPLRQAIIQRLQGG